MVPLLSAFCCHLSIYRDGISCAAKAVVALGRVNGPESILLLSGAELFSVDFDQCWFSKDHSFFKQICF